MNNTQKLIEALRRFGNIGLVQGNGEIHGELEAALDNAGRVADEVELSISRAEQGYTGHNAVGGLQAHSTGDRFPWTIIAQGGGDAPYQYRAFNCNTEQRGPLRDTAAAAGDDVDFAISLSRGECGARPHPSWLVAFLKVHQPRGQEVQP